MLTSRPLAGHKSCCPSQACGIAAEADPGNRRIGVAVRTLGKDYMRNEDYHEKHAPEDF